MGLSEYATTIEKAALTVSARFRCISFHCLTGISQTIAEGKSITGDLGGKASTKEYTSAIIAKIGKV
jgi:isocitrate/isopropylmalate dehydrogenase